MSVAQLVERLERTKATVTQRWAGWNRATRESLNEEIELIALHARPETYRHELITAHIRILEGMLESVASTGYARQAINFANKVYAQLERKYELDKFQLEPPIAIR